MISIESLIPYFSFPQCDQPEHTSEAITTICLLPSCASYLKIGCQLCAKQHNHEISNLKQILGQIV